MRLVADFGNRHGINVVSPFTFDLKLSEQFSHLFQLNTAKSLLYKPVVSDVMERFASHTIIFLTDSTEMEKKEAIEVLTTCTSHPSTTNSSEPTALFIRVVYAKTL